VSSAKLTHHDLCFGCGAANLFGLQMELEHIGSGAVAGRFFVKQDHQGPPGNAHGGVVAAALDEAMSLAIHAEGTLAYTARLSVELREPIPIGTFVSVHARIVERSAGRIVVRGDIAAEEGAPAPAAEAEAVFVEQPQSPREASGRRG
jgi:acyl-coenzyme A thioesterase PaaI-like protein